MNERVCSLVCARARSYAIVSALMCARVSRSCVIMSVRGCVRVLALLSYATHVPRQYALDLDKVLGGKCSKGYYSFDRFIEPTPPGEVRVGGGAALRWRGGA